MNWNKIPSLAALRAFEAAARCLNFSQAARELNVTHAAIVQHVRGLEAEFSETLVIRQGRGIALTAHGTHLAESLQAGFSLIEEGVEQLRAQGDNRPLNISVTPAFATHWLMPRIGDFWAKHPDVSLNINPGIDLVDMKRDGFDLAIRYGEGHWPNLEAELLTDGDFWVVARPDLIAGRQANCLPDVEDLPWFLEAYMLERSTILDYEDIHFDTMKVTLLNTTDLVLSAVHAGLGVTVQPKSIVEEYTKTGSLTKICELSQQGVGYYMVTLSGRDNPKIKPFRSWLRTQRQQERQAI